MPLTPEDVQNKRFTTTRFRPGYDEDEVDAFLDEVETELSRLLQENGDLRSRTSAVAIAAAPVETPLEAPSAPVAPGPEGAEGGQEAALKTLLLAQRTADEAITQARKEAEQIVSDARARATTLEQEASAKHAAAMADLERRRRDLERQVEDLRAFEREYRTRLKAYLETQLLELAGRGVAESPPPAAPARPSAPAPSGAPAGGAGSGPSGGAGEAPPSPPRPAAAGTPGAGAGAPPRPSPFGPAPTFTRPAPEQAAPEPSAPPREADRGADLVPDIEVDQGPEPPSSTG
jgi:DivIVA domain-containing protein